MTEKKRFVILCIILLASIALVISVRTNVGQGFIEQLGG